jgi:hypothetical protein
LWPHPSRPNYLLLRLSPSLILAFFNPFLKSAGFVVLCALGASGVYRTYKEYGTEAAIVVGTGVVVSQHCVYKAWMAPQPVPQPQPPLPPALPPPPHHPRIGV